MLFLNNTMQTRAHNHWCVVCEVRVEEVKERRKKKEDFADTTAMKEKNRKQCCEQQTVSKWDPANNLRQRHVWVVPDSVEQPEASTRAAPSRRHPGWSSSNAQTWPQRHLCDSSYFSTGREMIVLRSNWVTEDQRAIRCSPVITCHHARNI